MQSGGREDWNWEPLVYTKSNVMQSDMTKCVLPL